MVRARHQRLVRLLTGLFLASLLFVFPGGIAQAQDYRFSMDSNLVWVYIEEDASINIIYDITYTCDPGAHPIDIVDIGLPNDYYDLSSATATINDQPVTGIYKSEWLDTGVEIHLGNNTIMPGQTGTVHLEINNPHMVYQDKEDQDYASVRFYPHYYDSANVHGTTFLRLSIYFPPGVQPDETRYHDQQFTEADIVDGRPVMTWIVEQARPDQQYQFGVSFPKKYVKEVYTEPALDFGKMIGGLFTLLFDTLLPLTICGGILAWVVIGGVIGSLRARSRRLDYMPPLLSVEGMGVKRGLTAVEAAVLLEAPLNKVLTMILFGLVKKGALKVVSDQPLRLKKAEAVPEGLHPYEDGFLSAIKADGSLSQGDLSGTMTKLIKDVNQKMKGFHAKDTIAYYRDIVARGWKQVEAAQTPEVVDDNLEWMMVDDDFDQRMPQTFGDRPIPMPIWWWPTIGTPSTTAASRPSPGKAAPSTVGPRTVPGAQLANTVVGRIQGLSNTIVTNVSAFTAGVTRVTHPAPVSTSSGRGFSGGGGGCACACACAGCACACAGGGR
jgi:hypothetical protein